MLVELVFVGRVETVVFADEITDILKLIRLVDKIPIRCVGGQIKFSKLAVAVVGGHGVLRLLRRGQILWLRCVGEVSQAQMS